MRPITGSGLRLHSSIVPTGELCGKVIVSSRPEAFWLTAFAFDNAGEEFETAFTRLDHLEEYVEEPDST